MSYGVESDSSKLVCSGISQSMSSPSMRSFVYGYGEEENKAHNYI